MRRELLTDFPTGVVPYFGVEAEFTGISRWDAVAALRNAGFNAEDDGYHHSPRPYWRVTSDSSVTTYEDEDGNELVTPKLNFQNPSDLGKVSGAVNALRNAGAVVDTSCGLHVHHNVIGKRRHDLGMVAHSYRFWHRTLDRLVAPSRRSNGYCSVPDWGYVNGLYSGPDHVIYEPISIPWPRMTSVNLVAVGAHGSVEFRQHQGTLNPAKITNWIRLTKLFADINPQQYDILTDRANHLWVDEDGDGLAPMMDWLGAPPELFDFYVTRREELTRVGETEQVEVREYDDYEPDYPEWCCEECNGMTYQQWRDEYGL